MNYATKQMAVHEGATSAWRVHFMCFGLRTDKNAPLVQDIQNVKDAGHVLWN
jgi:hypothetical protein